MDLSFVPVTTAEQIEQLAALAQSIWREHFASLLSASQIEYMLEKFQSVPAMTAQLADGYRYFFLQKGEEAIGYTGVHPENGKLFLSKLYLRKEFRGQGYASRAFDFLESLCRQEGLSAIWLTVNRHNAVPIAVYQKKGFQVVREQVADIGSGYVMDDYVMEKTVEG